MEDADCSGNSFFCGGGKMLRAMTTKVTTKVKMMGVRMVLVKIRLVIRLRI
jgi:hypothetical protein